MKFFRFFINLLLAITIILVGLLAIADHAATAKYVQSVATKVNAYQTLSTLIPKQTAEQTNKEDPTEQQNVLKVLTLTLTPTYLQTQLADISSQFQTALKGGGGQVTINLSQIQTNAQNAGLQVPADQFKTVTITTTQLEKSVNAIHTAETAKLALIVAAVFLLLLSIFFSYWGGTYRGTGVALVVSGAFDLLILVGLFVVPAQALDKADFSGNMAAFSPIIHQVVNQIVKDLKLQFGVIALLLIVLGVLFLVFGARLPQRKDPTAVPGSKPQPKPKKQPAQR